VGNSELQAPSKRVRIVLCSAVVAVAGLLPATGLGADWTSAIAKPRADWTSADWTSADWTSKIRRNADWTSADWTSADWTSADWTSKVRRNADWTSRFSAGARH
jgi:uncharacterized protein YjbI with pentapeptide repeats